MRAIVGEMVISSATDSLVIATCWWCPQFDGGRGGGAAGRIVNHDMAQVIIDERQPDKGKYCHKEEDGKEEMLEQKVGN